MKKYLLSAFADEASSLLDGQVAALKRNGIKNIEIRNLDGSCIIDRGETYVKEVKLRLDSEGIGVSAIGSYIGKYNITLPLEPHLEAHKRAINAAQILGTERLRMFSFFIPKGEDPADYRGRVMENMNRLLDMCDGTGVVCCHENESGIYGNTAERVLDLHTTLGSRLKGIFDPANYIQNHENPPEIFESIYPFTEYLHIKDALLSDGAVVPAGDGDGDISGILERFSRAEDVRLLTVEPHLTVFAGLKDLQSEGLKHKFTYESQDAAFDAAVTALKNILNGGYDYE